MERKIPISNHYFYFQKQHQLTFLFIRQLVDQYFSSIYLISCLCQADSSIPANMASAPGNPMAFTYGEFIPPISSHVYPIAGILTTVYGLAELPQNVSEFACLWLLHPRLQTQACMAPLAAHTITEWNNRIKQDRASKKPKGLIAVSFDARNHGSREVDKLANEAWRQGNPRHAIDMFSCYRTSFHYISSPSQISY